MPGCKRSILPDPATGRLWNECLVYFDCGRRSGHYYRYVLVAEALGALLEFLGTLQTAKGSLLAHESHGFENPDAIPKLQSKHSNCVWVVYSHGDWDHCLGTGAVEDALGPSGISHVVSHRLTRCRLAEEGLKDIQELKIINPPLVEGAKVVLPNITFSERLTLHIGSQRVCTGDRGFQISGLRGEVSSQVLNSIT